jgi:hypothetical protein
VIKQKRLSDQVNNLPERLPITARYYLKNNHSTEPLVSDHLSHELIRDARINFLQLDALEICAQLTLRDFTIFQSIQPTEYVDHIFKLDSTYGIPQLSNFLKLPNQEMYWTITEILHESNLVQRSKIIKHFIKIASRRDDRPGGEGFQGYELGAFRMLQGYEEFQFHVCHHQWSRSQNGATAADHLGTCPGEI